MPLRGQAFRKPERTLALYRRRAGRVEEYCRAEVDELDLEVSCAEQVSEPTRGLTARLAGTHLPAALLNRHVLVLDVTMHDARTSQIADRRNDLEEEEAGEHFAELTVPLGAVKEVGR